MAKLSDAERRNLSAYQFALSGRRYPIEDKNHAEAALSDVGRVGTPEQKKEVRAKVHARYPNMK